MSELNISLMEGEDQKSLEELMRSFTQFIVAKKVQIVGYSLWADIDEPRNFCPPAARKLPAEEDIISGKIATFLLKLPTEAGERLLLLYQPVNQAQKLFYRLSESPAALNHRLYLTALGTPVILPRSYGFIEERQDKRLLRAAQVLEVPPTVPTLGEFLAGELKDADKEKRGRIFTALAKELAIIHNAGFYHPALRPCHILVLSGEKLGTGQAMDVSSFMLTFSDKMRFLKKYDTDHRAVNLYQFYRYALMDASESERFRFIESYCNYLPADSLDAEDLYRRVARHYSERVEQEETR